MPNTRGNLIKLLCDAMEDGCIGHCNYPPCCRVANAADHLIANGVTVQEWFPASEQPKKNGYYLCWILLSAVGEQKKYGQKVLFWEDNLWLACARSLRTEKPLYWMPLPQSPKGE